MKGKNEYMQVWKAGVIAVRKGRDEFGSKIGGMKE